jgi:hypothetical protein
MKNLISKSAQLLGVFFLCAVFTLSINAVFSGMLSILTGSAFLGIFRSDAMLVLSIIGFIVFFIMCLIALTTKKK